MYTEDDDKIKVKDQDSNSDYSDFYTSFIKQDEKKEKKKSKKEKKVTNKNEDDYAEFYGNDEYTQEESNGNVKKIIKIIAIILLVLLLIGLIVILLIKNGGKNNSADIELTNSSYSLTVGGNDYISYKIVGTDSNVISTFVTSNPSVVTVDENGKIMAVGPGDATITINYTIDGQEKSKQCNVHVEGLPIEHKINLNLKASTTSWTNKDVTVTVDASSDTSITSLKYAINCDSNCNYLDVVNNKIIVSNTGTTKVVVVAKDQSNLEIVKEVVTKIDKEAPSAKIDKNNYVSTGDVNVCVTCSDNLSGCKQGKVCKKFTSSKSNQTITVYDNAGNSKKSPTFNVTINKVVQPCTLKVSSDGVVSATLKENAIYYGFNSSCTGSNELSKKITINASKKGESGAKLVTYYIKNKNGNIGTCHITVIKECNCTDPKSTAANCPVTCTFRAN